MVGGLLLGLVLVIGLLSERVETDAEGIQVCYRLDPLVAAARLVHALAGHSGPVPVGTSQGGTVYYVKAADLRHQLLPRIERFDRFWSCWPPTPVSTKGIGRLTRPGRISSWLDWPC